MIGFSQAIRQVYSRALDETRLQSRELESDAGTEIVRGDE